MLPPPVRTGMGFALAPVPGAPVLLLRPGTGALSSLLLADVHLGLGANRDRPAGPPEGSGSMMASQLLVLARSTGAGRIVIAGDVKHPIVGTPPPLRPVVFDFFSTLLGAGLRVEVVLGNHDVGLTRHLPREVVVHPAGRGRPGSRGGLPRPLLAVEPGSRRAPSGGRSPSPRLPSRTHLGRPPR